MGTENTICIIADNLIGKLMCRVFKSPCKPLTLKPLKLDLFSKEQHI